MSWESQGLESQIVALLSASILRPFVLAAAAWLILRLFRVRHPASRHAVWTAVLIGMLVLPFLSVMTPHWSIPLPPSRFEPPVPAALSPAPPDIAAREPASHTTLPIAPAAGSRLDRTRRDPTPKARTSAFESVLIWFYLAGFLAMLAYRLAGWVLLRRVVSRSKPLRAPWLRESADVVSPVAIGVFRPAVLLPESWRGWSANTRSAVFAHEFAHLRRKDTLVASLARLLKCMLWFHPLAWWISREISELAELACDAAALESVGDAARYSRVLLEFASGVNGAGSRIALPGLAMTDSAELSHRIDQVFELSRGAMRKIRRPRAVLALLGVPALCLAATGGLGESAVPLARMQLSLLIKLPTAPPIFAQVRTTQAQPAQARTQAPAPPDRNAPRPRFDTASLEIAGPPVSGELCWGGCGGPLSPYPESRNQITYRHFTLRKILLRAYDVKDWLIIGPSSIDTDVYDVNATAAPGTTQEVFQVMLRNLLAERLQLKVHQDTRDFISGYDLVVADGGPKLKESQGPEVRTLVRSVPATKPGIICRPMDPMGPSTYSCQSASLTLPVPQAVTSIRDLTLVLSDILGVPVADATGLTKRYDIDLTQFVPDYFLKDSGGFFYTTRDPEQPFFYAALNNGLEKLGMRLEEKRTATEVLVVDHVQFVPTAK